MEKQRNIAYHVRALALILSPIAGFIVLYFFLGKWPNYLFNDIDTEGVYNLEKTLFGITASDGTILTPSEYFRIHHWAVTDVLSGLLYLCWIPLPGIYAIVLHFKGHSELAFRLLCAFLLCSIIGFIGYYAHPSCPPWYVMDHGFAVDTSTKGSAAGFINFDAIVGIPFFEKFYGGSPNVFAAIPSLHSAFNPVAFCYAMLVPKNRAWQFVLGFVSLGICFSAVYSGHHYVIDVVLGVLAALLAVVIFERGIMRLSLVKKSWKWVINVL